MSDGIYRYDDYQRLMQKPNRGILQRRQRRYVELFNGCERVLDLGCGEGLFLELLAQAGICGVGVDRDAELIQQAQRAGFEAIHGDALDHLASAVSEYDGIFCSHLIEHMTFGALVSLISAASTALKEGGILLLVFPNPEAIRMQCFGFWKDPEHVRFYHPDLIHSVCSKVGFRTEILHPTPAEPPLPTPGIPGIHRDWPSMELATIQERLRDIHDQLGQALAEKQSRFLPGEASLPGASFLRASEYILEEGGAEAMGSARGDVPSTAASMEGAYRSLQGALGILRDLVTVLGAAHERAAELLSESNERETAAKREFNHVVAQIVQTLNTVWGACEEAALLAEWNGPPSSSLTRKGV